MGYLGLWISLKGISPLNKKLEAKINIMKLPTKILVSKFIVTLNYQCYMWYVCSHTLQPLTILTYVESRK